MDERHGLTFVKVFDGHSDFEGSWLVIRAVGAWDKFPILTVSWEPCLKVHLHGCSVVESSGNNLNDLIWKLKRLVEFLRSSNHLVELFPRFVWRTEDKLLNFFELVDSEDAPDVLTTLSCFFSETRWVTSISNWQRSWFDLLFHVHCGNRLLRCRDKVAGLLILLFLLAIIFGSSLHFVKVFLEIRELTGGVHYRGLHEVWGLQWRVSIGSKQMKTIVNKSLIEENTETFEIVASVSGDFGSSFSL